MMHAEAVYNDNAVELVEKRVPDGVDSIAAQFAAMRKRVD